MVYIIDLFIVTELGLGSSRIFSCTWREKYTYPTLAGWHLNPGTWESHQLTKLTPNKKKWNKHQIIYAGPSMRMRSGGLTILAGCWLILFYPRKHASSFVLEHYSLCVFNLYILAEKETPKIVKLCYYAFFLYVKI